jgi:hypothetical protein
VLLLSLLRSLLLPPSPKHSLLVLSLTLCNSCFLPPPRLRLHTLAPSCLRLTRSLRPALLILVVHFIHEFRCLGQRRHVIKQRNLERHKRRPR